MEPGVYGFRTNDHSILTIDSIGWQTITSSEYRFAGDNRPDVGHVIFQYTLRGQGHLEFENQRFSLPKGTGFLVRIPSRHCYYYLDNGEPWEILWLNMRGDEANRIWGLAMEQGGPVFRMEASSPVIANLWTIFRQIAGAKMTDKYRLSVSAYEWMLTLLQSSRESGRELNSKSNSVLHQAKQLMKERYASPITLDMLAEQLRINKYYLCRLFQKAEHTSPLSYLRDRRIEAAIAMLRTTNLPIQEVGKRCGFESPSYFGKVFHAYMGLTPTAYREKKLEFPYDAIYYE
ncbi:AraC family transcriptional regulator [Paenibacillus lycopersici]|uniref:AraC family transcriptional regulator n=1 Tax=Paenibacillus lycopersici TaxID=2704462 RepID=A0A6C0FUU9_9BACL|nr:AraC family transcriptional regulator [Paenibacillus lycopersici]QHT59802.1 AraC family transcriptional regulator [Paenibacillus lycopersici]